MTKSGQTLRDWIEKHCDSQAAFAREAGISESHLSGILSGGARVSLDLAVKISRLTRGRVSVDAFVGE